MPQELQVLRCYSCHFFQVHIAKKNRKWECKMCGEKQSMKKVYGRGNGQDCRAHVQKLNKLAISQQENQISAYGSGEQSDHIPEDDIHGAASADFQNCRGLNPSASSSSKWNVYLDKPEKEDNAEEGLYQFGESLERDDGYSLKSSAKIMGNEFDMYNAESIAFSTGKYFPCNRRGLNPSVGSSSKWNTFLDKPEKEDNGDYDLHPFNESLEQDAGYSLSSVESMGNEVDIYNAESTAFRNRQYYQAQHRHLNKDLNLSTNIFKCSTESKNIYKNSQEDSLSKLPQNKWLKYVDKTDIQRGRNVKQLSDHVNTEREKESVIFKTSSKWHTYLEKPTYETEASELVETPVQLTNNKISELAQSSGTVQPGFPSTTTEKQMLPRKEITMSVNETVRDYGPFDRDYTEDELNSILDIHMNCWNHTQ